MLMKKRLFLISFMIVLAVMAVGNSHTAHALNYPSAYSDYETEFDIRTSVKTTESFSFTANFPGSNFRLFIPPGATYINLQIYVNRDSLIGVAARIDQKPQCTYNTNQSEDQFGALPWKSPSDSSISIADYRVNDIQYKNRGGTIKAMEEVLSTEIPSPGEWLLIRDLSFDGSRIMKLTYTVYVNVATYNAWYTTTTFTDTGDPALTYGSAGGTCAAAWNQDYVEPEPEPPVDPGPPADATVEITSPADNETVSGVVTLTGTITGTGAKAVEFFVNNFSVGKDTTASGSPETYSVSWDTSALSGPYTITASVTDDGGTPLDTDEITLTVVVDPSVEQVLDAETLSVLQVDALQVSGQSVTLNPKLVFSTALTGEYDCYAMYLKGSDIFVAEEDGMWGGVAFQRLCDGGALKSYKKQTFSGASSWECGAFDNMPTQDIDDLKSEGLVFLVAVSKEGSGVFEGVIFSFTD